MKGGEQMVNNTVNAGGFEVLAAPSRGSSRNERADGRSFDSFLATPRREDVARQPERPSRTEGERESRDNVRSRNIETTVRTVTHEQTAQHAAECETAEVVAYERAAALEEMPEQTLENPDIVLALLEDEVLAEIAAVLGITTQALAEILNALGMTPTDLLESQAQTELLQLLHGLDDEVALLNLPATLPIMQEISKTMAKYAPVLLEYQAEMQNQPQYAALEEAALANLEAEAESELVPTVRAARNDAPGAQEVDLPVDYEAMEVLTTTAVTAENTASVNAEPQQSIEPIIAFAQATEQPIESFARPATVEAPLPQAPVNSQNVMEQIVSHMRFEVRGDMAEIRIQLKPEHLGEVSLRIATQNGIVVAQFVAESQRVKEIIESNFSQLRDALEQQGINISEIEVSVAQGEADRQFAFESNISGDRIRDVRSGAEEDEMGDADADVRLEENLVDYLA
jgi:flagellar hook-length control protein FliK